MTRPDLTDAEVNAMCAGLRQNAAKVRFLRGLGLTVATRPNGRPLVNRTHYDAVCIKRWRGFAVGSWETMPQIQARNGAVCAGCFPGIKRQVRLLPGASGSSWL
jgi:hypothetical protein